MEQEIKTIGVVGAGVMGRGVAQNLAQSAFNVVMVDHSAAALESARTEISQALRFQGFFNKASREANPAAVLARIQTSREIEALNGVDYLIENVTENWEIKRKVYLQLDKICRPEVAFAVNTSAISITRVGSVTSRPAQVVGIHFMNPVPKKPAVELIRGVHTSEKTISITQNVLCQMGKKWVMVNDAPGFISNRVLMLTINEAVFLLLEGVAGKAEDVDEVFRSCFGHPMGPLETADLIGVDTILYSLEVLYESYNDPKFRPCPLLKRMVDAGFWGRKSGRGFYEYNANGSIAQAVPAPRSSAA
jgi:3-hydroxybutyryl-CoA dehydrogenase